MQTACIACGIVGRFRLFFLTVSVAFAVGQEVRRLHSRCPLAFGASKQIVEFFCVVKLASVLLLPSGQGGRIGRGRGWRDMQSFAMFQ